MIRLEAAGQFAATATSPHEVLQHPGPARLRGLFCQAKRREDCIDALFARGHATVRIRRRCYGDGHGFFAHRMRERDAVYAGLDDTQLDDVEAARPSDAIFAV